MAEGSNFYPENESLLSPNPHSIIDHLNDDCRIKVFEYLPLRDLCNVAQVCSVFESNTVSVFKRTFSDCDLHELIDEGEIDSRHDYWDDELTASLLSTDSVERLFHHFGACIQTLCLDRTIITKYQQDRIFDLLATYCAHKNSKLEKLVMIGNIDDIKISKYLIPRLQYLFDNLKSLEIMGGQSVRFYVGASELTQLTELTELTELTLDDTYLDYSFIRRFEKLQTVSLLNVQETDAGILEFFLENNQQLKSLTIVTSEGRDESFWLKKNLFSIIGSLPELEELQLHMKKLSNMSIDLEEDFVNLARLKHLKVFSLTCFGWPTAKLFNIFAEQRVPIEELDLRNFTLDSNLTTILAKFSEMKKLCFADGKAESGQLLNAVREMLHLQKLHISNVQFVTLHEIKATIKNAPELRELQLDFQQQDSGQCTVNAKDFDEICQYVAKRRNGIKLNLNISGSRCKLEVPTYIIERNSMWLEVNVITFKDVERINVIDYYSSDSSESSEENDVEASEAEMEI